MNSPQEEYLTVAELSERIKFSKQTIYNLIWQKVFEINKHFIKPRPKKILFIWAEVKTWLERSAEGRNEGIEVPSQPLAMEQKVIPTTEKVKNQKSAIRI